MNPKLKLFLYVVAIGCLAGFGYALYTTFRAPEPPVTGQGTGTTNQLVATQLVAVITTMNGTAVTNTSVVTNAVESTNHVAGAPSDPPEDLTPRRSSARLSRLMAYGVILLFSLVGLSLLIAQDF